MSEIVGYWCAVCGVPLTEDEVSEHSMMTLHETYVDRFASDEKLPPREDWQGRGRHTRNFSFNRSLEDILTTLETEANPEAADDE